MKFSIVNRSTRVNATDAARIAEAVCIQVQEAALLLGVEPAEVAIAEDESAGTVNLTILDDTDQAGALGYHALTPSGLPYVDVFAGSILRDGGGVLAGASTPWSVSACVSHEILETLYDPNTNLWSAPQPLGQVAMEVCDPVEASFYQILSMDGTEINVSDFVLPSWFDATNGSPPFDKLGKITAPFEVAPGGYLIVRTASGISYVPGPPGMRVPNWRIAARWRKLSRMTRRRDIVV